MPIRYAPTPGLVVICDYSKGFKKPEMVKERLGVVVSKRLPHRDGLCTVVPLSTSPSRSGVKYQCKVELPIEAPDPYPGKIKWAKADMLATVGYHRLELPYSKRDPNTGRRKYIQIKLPAQELEKIQIAMLFALGFEQFAEQLIVDKKG